MRASPAPESTTPAPTRKPIGWGAGRAGGRKRLYDRPRTPPGRLLDTDAPADAQKDELIDYRSRLDPAADHARADGARVLLVWAVRGDESVRGLLAGAGLERTPSRRELPVGRGVTEECWGAAL